MPPSKDLVVVQGAVGFAEMNCPKCGFSQPDDIYCALCGVNVEKYAQQKRKRRRKTGFLAAFLAVATLAAASFFMSSPKDELVGQLSKNTTGGGPSLLSHRTSDGQKIDLDGSLSSSQHNSNSKQRRRDNESRRAKQSTSKGRDETLTSKEGEPKELSAKEWFEKGHNLDDDSEAEIECYLKAKELDPRFAPAAFRLAAIYFRQAKYELADREFAHFMKTASDEDRQNYDIYVYYSSADVERLSASINQQAAEEAKQQEAAPEQNEETGQEAATETLEEDRTEQEGEEANRDTTEEVLTVVEFSQINGQIVVPVTLNDNVMAKVLVDTGAGITVLSTALADELDLEIEVGRSITLKTMAMDIQAKLGKLDSIQVGNIKKYDFPVVVTDLPRGEQSNFKGILGMDFMNHYTIHIDNKRLQIALSPKTP
jgi:tetratricopeptide (TPR) repeat protein